VVRRRLGSAAVANAPQMDVVWCKVPPLPGFRGARAYLGHGHLLLCYRTWDDRLQIAWGILKGTFGELRQRSVEGWVEQMAHHVSEDLASHLRSHGGSISHPFLLDAVSDCVEGWSAPGALLVGDAAHTMSPVGAQGLNLALRDAIAAANELVPVLLRGASTPEALDAAARRVEAARRPEIEAVQRAQALPPRVAMSRAWWGEPVRRLLALVVRSGVGRRIATGPARLFAFGTGPLRLHV
jgi:2-polyprenyl-6-methoxyphenol hydroxylase-like FAD-dependent oxidoreductase